MMCVGPAARTLTGVRRSAGGVYAVFLRTLDLGIGFLAYSGDSLVSGSKPHPPLPLNVNVSEDRRGARVAILDQPPARPALGVGAKVVRTLGELLITAGLIVLL